MWVKLAYGCIALAWALVLWPPRSPRHDLRVTFLDVGQADAAIVETPHGHTIAIDTGGRLERGVDREGNSPAEEIGERIVVPFLIRHGIHHVDAVIISHPHGDHVGGLAPILRTLGADLLFDGGQEYGGHAYRDGLQEAHRRHVHVIAPRAGDAYATDDGVRLRFLTSSGSPIEDAKDPINENSLVALLECDCGRSHPFRVLFTGDAGTVSERLLLDRRVDLRADVLKVGHHGSRYASSSDFISAVSPRMAIISDGRRNVYHHPAPRTLAALTAAHARIWRTDRCGAIILSVSARTLIGTTALQTCP